ncbi:MAG: hypothetical protein SFU25_08850 [Candidatus Caenarcaniphilales bacterium]|nr:hypothetical protein [Candidatus Caenarcaniphilales bacterium]
MIPVIMSVMTAAELDTRRHKVTSEGKQPVKQLKAPRQTAARANEGTVNQLRQYRRQMMNSSCCVLSYR